MDKNVTKCVTPTTGKIPLVVAERTLTESVQTDGAGGGTDASCLTRRVQRPLAAPRHAPVQNRSEQLHNTKYLHIIPAQLRAHAITESTCYILIANRAFPDPNIGVPDPKFLLWTPKIKPLGSLGTPKITKIDFILRLYSCLVFFTLANFSQ